MSLNELLRWTLGLLQLRSSPEQLPASRPLMVELVLLDLGFVVVFQEAIGLPYSLAELAFAWIVEIAVVLTLLWLFGYAARAVQTLSAMAAASLAINAVLLPITLGLVRSREAGPSLDLELLQLGWLSLLLWSIVVKAHVLRHALSILVWYALPLALLSFIITAQLTFWMFPTE